MTVALLILLTSLQIADWWTTRRILAMGGYERNPVVRWLMAHMGADVGLVAAKAAVIGLGLLAIAFLGPLATPALLILCGLYAVVIAGNLRVIGRLQ